MSKPNFFADLIDGAIAGAVATWALDQITTVLYEREDKQAREKEDSVRGGQTAYGVAAQKAAKIWGVQLDKEQTEQLGTKIHWGLGMTAGALYGVLRNRAPSAALANGLLFGTLFFLANDEGLVYALGLTPGPTKFPWQAHARGLAGHLAFGAAAETTLKLVSGSPSTESEASSDEPSRGGRAASPGEPLPSWNPGVLSTQQVSRVEP